MTDRLLVHRAKDREAERLRRLRASAKRLDQLIGDARTFEAMYLPGIAGHFEVDGKRVPRAKLNGWVKTDLLEYVEIEGGREYRRVMR